MISTIPVFHPRSPRLFLLLLLFSLVLTLPRIAESQDVKNGGSGIPVEKMLHAVREYARHAPPPQPAALTSPASLETEDAYSERIRSLLSAEKFDDLEMEVHAARANKSRVVGGTWKLIVFYQDLATPSGCPNEAACEAAIAEVKKWIAARPQSAAARIALASLYLDYASSARGRGYANTVSETGWGLFGQRIELAKATLLEAASLNEKCLYWFEAMQIVALDEGWDKPQARELFDLAVSFEPSYYHFYREYANYLLPKWYGEEGETQAFANEVSSRNPEPFGSILYFEIATLQACQCDPSRNSLEGFSWPKIKQGYAAINLLYGVSTRKQNRFAFMAYMARDKSTAQDAFASIGVNWDRGVWSSPDNFVTARAWANSRSISQVQP